MSLDITLSINGRTIDTLHVVNRGHPLTGDHPAADDLRLYSWESNLASGMATHRRRDGAHQLAVDVMRQAARAARRRASQ